MINNTSDDAFIIHELLHLLLFYRPKKDLIGDDDDEISYCTLDDDKGDPTLYHDTIDEEEEEEELVGVANEPGLVNGDELGLDEQVEVTSEPDDVFESTGDPQSAAPKGVKFFNIVKSLSRRDVESGDDGNRIELKSMKSRSPSNSSSKLQSTSVGEVRRRPSNKRPRGIDFEKRRQRLRGPSCLLMEHQSHAVYQPKTPTAKNRVIGSELGGDEVPQETPTPSPHTPASAPRTSLKERQQDFDWHVKTTQEVVKERTEEIINNEQRAENVPRKLNLRDVTKRVTMRSKAERQPKLANVVADALARLKEDSGSVSDKGENDEVRDSGPLSVPTTFTTASIANAWRDRAKKQNSQDARKSMVLVPVNKIPELKKRVSMVRNE